MTKIFFQTHGCSTNFSESEVMAGLLAKAGFKITNNKDNADIIIINICTVKGETTALKEIRKTKEEFPDKKLIVAGCIPPEITPKIREINEDTALINTHNIKRITEVVEETLQDNVIEALTGEDQIKICLPKIRKNPVIGIIPILSGCNSYCSYCSVKLIKGNLFSYPIENIIEETKNCLKDGCKEIWITSQDNTSYMLEKDGISKLSELLNEILKVNGKFFVRIGMMNPQNILPIIDELIEIYKNEKIFKFLHIPVQSGNNEILKLMKRGYVVNDFKNIISKFRKEIPNITISTDIICGFPTETEQQFNDSLNLIKEIKPDIINISKFIARPGTEAYNLEQLSGEVVKSRSRLLTGIFHNIARMQNEKWLDWQGNILIDEKGKNESFIGRNLAYKPIIIKGNFRLGDFVKVKIRAITSFDLRGDVI